MEIIKDKNVLIVGATGGIGKATALLLKQSGANLFVTSRDESKLAELSALLDLPSHQTFLLDITDANAVKNVAENIHQQIPAIDILINAAGIGIIKPIENLTEQDFMQTVQVNLAGAFYLVKNFIEPMKIAKKGLIINIPGVLGKTPMAGAAAYSASKYGLNGMMKSIREELKRIDILKKYYRSNGLFENSILSKDFIIYNQKTIDRVLLYLYLMEVFEENNKELINLLNTNLKEH